MTTPFLSEYRTFRDRIKPPRKSPQTYERYKTMIQHYLEFYAKTGKPIKNMTMRDVDQFVNQRIRTASARKEKHLGNIGGTIIKKGEFSSAAINNYVVPIRLFLKANGHKALAEEIEPAKNKRMPPRLPTAAELKKAFEHAYPLIVQKYANSKNAGFLVHRDWFLVNFLLDTAARIGEAHNLEHAWLQTEKEPYYVRLVGKTGPRVVRCSAKLVALYKKFVKNTMARERHVFVSEHGTQMNLSYMKGLVKEYLAYSPHKLRHFTGVQWHETLGARVAQRLLGHAKAETTAIYAQMTLEKDSARLPTGLEMVGRE